MQGCGLPFGALPNAHSSNYGADNCADLTRYGGVASYGGVTGDGRLAGSDLRRHQLRICQPRVGKGGCCVHILRLADAREEPRSTAWCTSHSRVHADCPRWQLVSTQPLEYDLHIRPDTLNARHRVWFYFSVRGARAGQKAIFNIVGYSKTKSLFRDGMAPVVCTSARPFWERMPPAAAYYYRSPRHDHQYVLSFPFCFERADETYYFAYCFPYTYSYLQRFLCMLDSRAMPCLVRSCLCRTLQVCARTIGAPQRAHARTAPSLLVHRGRDRGLYRG